MLKYKVMNCTGHAQDHTLDLSFEEAEALCKELEDDFPGEAYEVHPYEHTEKKERIYRNDPNQVDGWEDLFNR